VPQGRKYTPRDMASSMYISEWDLQAATSYYQQLVPQGRIYTQGHGIPPCIYQNGIYTVPRLLPAA
jgi:hypothetical protein